MRPRLKLIAISTVAILNFSMLLGNAAYANQCGPKDAKHFLQTIADEPATILVRDPDAKRLDRELFSAGSILHAHEKLGHLKDGVYNYVVFKSGETGIVARVPNLQNQVEPMASHRSILNHFFEIFKKEPEVIAAGEFEIKMGRVAELNNRSGTFKNGNTGKQLKLAEERLKNSGLNVEEHTFRDDYSLKRVSETETSKHGKDMKGALAYTRIHHDPTLATILEAFRRNEKYIYEHYPSKIPGRIDWNTFLQTRNKKLTGHLTERFFDENIYEWSWAMHMAGVSDNYNFFPEELIRMQEEIGNASATDAMKHLVEIEGSNAPAIK